MTKITKVKYYTTVEWKYLDEMKLMSNFITIYLGIIIFWHEIVIYHYQYTNLANFMFLDFYV